MASSPDVLPGEIDRALRRSGALAMAVVHCDVVVTERHAAALLREARLDARHSTVVLTDLADLAGALIAAAG